MADSQTNRRQGSLQQNSAEKGRQTMGPRTSGTSRHGQHLPSRIILPVLAALLVIFLGVLLFGGQPGGQKKTVAKDGRPTVVVSVNQWQSIVSRVAGRAAHVSAILTNSGVDAHDYEPDADDQSRLASADIVVVNGAGYDEWATRAAQSGHAQIIDAARLVGVKDGDNPHIWFASRARTAVAKAVRTTLEKREPDRRKALQASYAQWQGDEDRLDLKIAAIRHSLQGAKEGRPIRYAASEAVAYYLARDLGLSDATPAGYTNATQNDSEPAPSDMRAFDTLLSQRRVRFLIVNTQEESKTTQQLLASARKGGVPIVRLTETRPRHFSTTISWISSLVDEFQEALDR